MRTLALSLFAYALAFLFLSGCSDNQSLRLIDTNFDEEVQTNQNLHFVFNQPIAGDSTLNLWDSTQYIAFNPPVKGWFKWSGESVLVFSPESPFPPATTYEATITEKLSAKAKRSFSGEKIIRFHTTPLQVLGFTGFWSNDDTQDTFIHIEAAFNHAVSAEEAAGKMQVKLDGNKQTVKALHSGSHKTIRVYLPNVKLADKDFEMEITLEEGLTPVGGKNSITAPTTETVTLSSPYQVSIEDISTEHNGAEGIVNVNISQQTTDKIAPFVRISPSVKFVAEPTEKGLKISSEAFDMRKTYTVTIAKGLKGKFGGELAADFSKEISFGKLRPEISIENKRSVYLSGQGEKNIQVKIINVEEIDVRITKLYENNIINFTRNKYYNYRTNAYSYSFHNAASMGDLIWEKKIKTNDLPKKGGVGILHLDIEDKLQNYRGIYALEISSDEKYWLRDNRLLAISDIGLVAKEGKKHVTVFCNAIKTAQPMAGVEVRFVGRNNQQLGNAITDKEGVAVFEKPTDLPHGFDVELITAQTQDDYNFMTLSSSRVNTAQFDIGGKYQNPTGFDLYLYGDRDIYRPGETLHVSGILRDLKWQTPDPIPLKIVITTPDGKTLKTIKKTLNAHGSFETSVELSPPAPTGNYAIQVYTSNDVFLTSRSVQVEEFMPDRIKLDMQLNKTELTLNESTEIALTATNFFGPPAGNRNYEIAISAKRKNFYPKEFPDYNFNIDVKNHQYFERILHEGKTDANGKAQVDYALEQAYKDMGLVQADVYATVFDETGRPVNRKQSVTVSTQKIYYGIASDRYYTPTNSEIRFPMVALDRDENLLNGVATQLQIIKHEFKTVLSKSGSFFRYNSEEVEKVLVDKEIVITGSDDYFSFVPELSGRYEIRLSAPGSSSYVSQSFYAYGWGGTSNASFEVNSEGKIDITLDKESYTVGETAQVILKSPFSGKILVTLETDKILKHFYVDSDKRAASFPIDITEAYVPNIYITATLFKPHAESDLPLTIAHGVAPLLVHNPDNQLPISIEAVSKSRSGTKQTLTLSSTPHTAVSVAVVDEGILQLTRYSSPDPYSYFYQKRSLGVESYDIYPFLFPEIQLSGGRIGGDNALAAELAKRINPLTNKRVKLVSFWSGIMETDQNGKATYEIDIPSFSGDLRVMATAYSAHRFGSASHNIKVADPMVISTALPRFLSPGDTVDMPVVLSNTTKSGATCQTNVRVSGPISVVGQSGLTADVPGNGENRVNFQIVAHRDIGQATIHVSVKAMGETFENRTDMAVRPSAPLQKISGSGVIKANTTEKLSFGSNSFLPNTAKHKLVLSNSPAVEFADNLNYLLRYPHHCLEQTVSTAFPQLYFSDLSQQLLQVDDKFKNANSNYHITEAIKKIQLMQLYHGGLSYWPGQGYESWWGSAYAAHFLFEAKKAGYAVDEQVYNKLLDYLITRLKTKETIWYYYNNTRRKIANKEIPYSLYVLALAGKPQRSTMNYYKSNMDDLSLDGKYLLAASYAIIGDDKKYREVLPSAFAGEKSDRVFGGSFYSYIRDQALALNTLLEVDPENPQVATMTRQLSQAMKNEKYLNTQERAFGFLALGKIARLNASNDIRATVRSGSKTLATYNQKTLTLAGEDLQKGLVDITNSGEGSLYHYWESEGISADGSYRQEDSFLKVRKAFFNRYGTPFSSLNFKQNELIVVRLSIQAEKNQSVENVAITDMLPAGFEIENPRITDVPGTDWITNASTPDYSDIRDDRITLFTHVRGSKAQHYYYVVRAVSKGTFEMGPVGADAMYNGEYHSYHGAGKVTIE